MKNKTKPNFKKDKTITTIKRKWIRTYHLERKRAKQGERHDDTEIKKKNKNKKEEEEKPTNQEKTKGNICAKEV